MPKAIALMKLQLNDLDKDGNPKIIDEGTEFECSETELKERVEYGQAKAVEEKAAPAAEAPKVAK